MGPFRVVRPADMLVVDIALVNLRFDGGRLVRREPAAPTLIVVGLPPQHVMEEIPQNPDPAAGPLRSVKAFASEASQLVFSVPPEVDSLSLSLASLLDWERLVPMTVPVVQPGATPPTGLPGSVLEFPTRLLLTYDEPVTWVCPSEPRSPDGRTGLWHALLSSERGGEALLRALGRADGRASVPSRFPLSAADLEDLVILTSRAELIDTAGAPIVLPSAPLRAEQFIATPLGASAHLHGAWDKADPSVGPRLEAIGRHRPEVAAYDHITGLGRDQFVRVVIRGFLSTGHPALLVSEFKRRFVAHRDDGIVAYLRQEDRIVLREPEVSYGESTGFPHQAREMPFRALRVTDRVTPLLKPAWPPKPADRPEAQPEARQPFWVELESGGDHQFTLLGTDHEGRQVSFTTPLVFVPDSKAGDADALESLYASAETKEKGRLDRPLGGQVMAMAQPPADAPGSTSHAVGRLSFAMSRKVAGGEHPLAGTLVVSGAEVRVPALEPFTPKAGEVPVVFNAVYRDHGMAAHPARAYLDLVDAIGLDFAAEKVGGLARPNAAVKVITSQAGVVPDMFEPDANGGVGAADITRIQKAFGAAKLLGFIDLSALVGPVLTQDLDRLRQLGDNEIQALLDAEGGTIPAPVLRVRDLADAQGRELRYVWKTKLVPPDPPPPGGTLLDVSDAVLTLDARTVVSKEAGEETSIEGRLRDIALEIAGVARVEIADLRFKAAPGNKPDVSASGLELKFLGELRFIDTLRSALPADAFGSGAFVDVQPSGIRTGYALAVPDVPLGVFALTNVCLKLELDIPFVPEKAISFRFSVSERQRPFNVTVTLFGGGGYFSMLVDAEKGIREAEGAIEFGGGAALNLGVASGGVTVMAGVRLEVRDGAVKVGGYLRCSGFLSVLGIVTVSVEFYLELTYEKHGNESVVRGRGTLTVSVKIAFFSKSVSLELERSFSGAPGDPTFVDCFDRETHWEDYCLSFDGDP